MIVLRENNPHRLDGKKYSNFGNSPVNYKMKMMQNNGFAMPSSHLPFFEGRQGCWRFSRDSAENLIDGGDGAIPTIVGSA